MEEFVLDPAIIESRIGYDREYVTFRLPMGGRGFLAGTFPDGITSVEGVPGPATIRVLLRTGRDHPGDGVVVSQVHSDQDGTWIVEGLNPDLRFDVVCRSDGYNDMILSDVTPVTD